MTATPAMTSNDPRDLDGKRLQLAMQTLGRDPALRARMIALLRECEGQIACAGSVRDEVVGPIIDALHLDVLDGAGRRRRGAPRPVRGRPVNLLIACVPQ